MKWYSVIVGAALACAAALAAPAERLPPPGATVPDALFGQWQAALRQREGLVHGGQYLNALVLENSPYLLQHAGNPVNWVPWSAASLEQARAGDRLIFLSIGYSTCHWCHVMNRQSFSDPAVARRINEHFVAIKVDREELPAIDQYYSGILAMVKVSAGWPLTAILDASGNPIFVEAFLAPEALLSLLSRAVELAETQPQLLAQSARFLADAAASSAGVATGDETALAEAELAEVAGSVLGNMDTEYGGLAGTQKFPNEALLAFLADMHQRRAAPGLAAALELQLSRMARGGVYDHVNGGFFRYSTDPTWTVPHYEKMLYNQALLLKAYGAAYRESAQPLYRWLILDLAAFLERWMQEQIGYASAVSADTGGVEGLYYLWLPGELESLPAADVRAAGLASYAGPGGAGRRGLFMRRPETDAAARLREHLRWTRQAAERPFVDRKVITAWNAALVSGLLAAHAALGDEVDLASIEALAERLWRQAYAGEESLLYRIRYQGGRGVPGTLEDYAFMTSALLDLYDTTRDRHWLDRAGVLGRRILESFADEGRLAAIDRRENGAGVREPATLSDGELPAGDAVALRALWRLSRRQENPALQGQLGQLVAVLRQKFRRYPLANLYAGSVLAEIDRVVASVEGEPDCPRAVLDIELADGWHVNSATPVQDYLRPTQITLGSAAPEAAVTVTFPEPELVSLSFEEQPLSVYQGRFALRVSEGGGDGCAGTLPGAMVLLDVQACTDRVCKAPEKLRFRLPARR